MFPELESAREEVTDCCTNLGASHRQEANTFIHRKKRTKSDPGGGAETESNMLI